MVGQCSACRRPQVSCCLSSGKAKKDSCLKHCSWLMQTMVKVMDQLSDSASSSAILYQAPQNAMVISIFQKGPDELMEDQHISSYWLW